jgi:hypothetical protein
MKRTILVAALFALAACNDAGSGDERSTDVAAVDGVDPNADAGFEAVAPGKYEIVHADGSIDELTVLPGMTWAMVSAKGEPTGGTLFEQAGKKCFVTEGVPGQRCFAGTEPAADGSIEVTGDDGEKATVRPVKEAAPSTA